jgi:hypothetical protein
MKLEFSFEKSLQFLSEQIGLFINEYYAGSTAGHRNYISSR